jgi:hypothetical protein
MARSFAGDREMDDEVVSGVSACRAGTVAGPGGKSCWVIGGVDAKGRKGPPTSFF